MTDLSGLEPIDRWARSAHPERRCTAHRKNGDQCKNAARQGTNVCDFHGAKAPQVKRKARERLEEATDRLARELLCMATDPNVSESVRLSAIRDALDRGGVSAKSAVEVEVGPLKPYEQIFDGLACIESGSRAEFRRSQELSEDAENRGSLGSGRRDPSMPIEAEVFDYPRNGGVPTYRRRLPPSST
jgi:hypothetical protein